MVIGHFFSGDGCSRLRGRRIGDRFTSGRRAGCEQTRNEQNQNACRCDLFNHRPEPRCGASLMQPVARDGGHRQQLQSQRWAPQFRIPSAQSLLRCHLREHMPAVRSGHWQMSSVVLRGPILLPRLAEKTRHKRKAATRSPNQASHTVQNVYSRSRTYRSQSPMQPAELGRRCQEKGATKKFCAEREARV